MPEGAAGRRPRLPAAGVLRRHSTIRQERLTLRQEVRANLVSVAGLVGTPVLSHTGVELGRLVDVVARLYTSERYPPVTGLVVRVGRRRAFLDAGTVADVRRDGIRLSTARMDLRDFTRRPGEVLLARDVLDHQLVDVEGVQVIRAADLLLTRVGQQTLVVGVDVSLQSLLRRLGPRRLRRRPTPDRVIDWQAVAPFSDTLTAGPSTVRLRTSQQALQRLRPSELADLLEDLGRPGRQELLASLDTGTAADALEEMDASELTALLREAEPGQAAELVAAMEPDEAVDALRELTGPERRELLELMPAADAGTLRQLLDYPEDRAAGFMTTTLVTVRRTDTVAEVRRLLAQLDDHRDQVDAVVVVDDAGALLADVPLFDLLVAPDDVTLEALHDRLGRPEPVTAEIRDDVDTVAARLVDSRRSSLLVVDEECRPLGRILADDVLDALRSQVSRMHFPRLLA